MFQNTDKSWEKYGFEDAYFGVLNQDKFKRNKLDENSLQDFFDSGKEHINNVIDTIQKHLEPGFQPKQVLDFGCGVGRLLIPLAQVSEQVVGLDISDSMLAEAKKNCERNSIHNVKLVKSDDSLSGIAGEKYDFIHSYIVFQHMSVRRGEAILAKMIEHLSDRGIAVLHFTYHYKGSKIKKVTDWMRQQIPLVQNIVNLYRKRKFDYPVMLMNQYSLNKLYLILQNRNIYDSYVRFTNDSGHLGIILYFQKQAT